MMDPAAQRRAGELRAVVVTTVVATLLRVAIAWFTIDVRVEQILGERIGSEHLVVTLGELLVFDIRHLTVPPAETAWSVSLPQADPLGESIG